MTNKIDYGEWNPDRIETDNEDLRRSIYAYYCNKASVLVCYPSSRQIK